MFIIDYTITMFTVTLLAQKGGVGKTSLALTLAVLADLQGATVGVVDADPSANATEWNRARQKRQDKKTPAFASAATPKSSAPPSTWLVLMAWTGSSLTPVLVLRSYPP